MFAIVSVLAGVLVAGLFVPYAGLAGMGSKAAADELNSLPTELATPTPPTRSTVYMADGKVLAYFYDENRIPVALNKIAPVMRQAQLAIEDHRYYEHGALDVKGTLRALVRNSTSDVGTQGGSSITQQYVKMVQIESCQSKGASDAKIKKCVEDAKAPTMERKVRELRYAIALEKRLTKDQILSNYLNIAYYGDGAYGVEAAAKHYYNTSASKLNLGQAAMLAGLVQNPDANNPMNNRAAALDRRDVVLNRMGELGLATPAEIKKAKQQGFDTKAVKSIVQGCVGTRYPFLCDYVRRTLEQSPSLGDNVRERNTMLDRGGLKIYTAIDPKSQDLAQKKVSAFVGAKDPLISTMNMIQPGTGLIVASAQSRPVMGSDKKKGQTYFNLSAPSEMGGIQGYQAGSTFKAFTMAAALEKGIPISKKFNAKSPYDFTGRTFDTCDGRGKVYDKWRVKNSVGHSKTIGMTEAAEWSVNTYFVQLELATGMCGVTKMAEKTGIKVGHQLGAKPINIVKEYQDKPSFTLGTAEVAPMSVAEAYATFASGGIHCSPIIVSKIVDRKGKQLDAPSANCKRVMDEDVADGVNKVLKSVIYKGTGTRALVRDGRDQAGKTGTIDSAEAVWFAGYTPEIAGVAMISIDNQKKPFMKGKPGFRSHGVTGYRVPSTGRYLEGSGSGDSGQYIWKPVMEQYFKSVPRTKFEEPASRIKTGKKVTVPYVGNLSIAAATKKLEKAGFDVSTQYVYSNRPKYTFLGWSPGAGARVSEFSTVYKLVSKGKDPAIARAKAAAEAKKKADAKKKAEDKKKDDKKKGDG
ncbi:Membrane carboxypeptidase (penicillin-binding protein) [Microlunatus sagamiharensis]|uniref:Membrane carboxypeptidase (Penicillin-binding protein) n=2 Tax=Microlunatus sagamiharensis TaxID=546874 RepID=A0A1H2NEN9_9ACTN|nr:Membrane carboxypeptidase (penicillin-binding protein) [Microlunatus sagamiharensis]